MTGVLSFALLIVACKFVTESMYIENTETKQKQRLMAHNIDQFSSPFAIKKWCFVCTSMSPVVILVVEMGLSYWL